ncbi:MAG: hypothetical protein LC640_01675, partial [Frankia sp.]|nr:hypothetical protein [Frankia sp.]
ERPRRTRMVIVAAVGAIAVAIDGAPAWGSDFGGVVALVPGFGVLTMLVGGVRVTWRRVAALAAAAVVAVAGFAVMDYLRPPAARTHVGRFVAQLRDGGAGPVLRRKAAANAHLLFHSVLTLIVPLAVVFLAVVLARPRGRLRVALAAVPALRAALLAILVTAVVGFVANDSGVAVPAFALTIAVPAAIAVAVAFPPARPRETGAGAPD